MVHHHEQYVVDLAETEQSCSDQRAGRQVERAPSVFVDDLACLAREFSRALPLQVDVLDLDLKRPLDSLNQTPVPVFIVGPEALMTGNYRIHRSCHGCFVQTAFEPQSSCNVVSRATRFKLI